MVENASPRRRGVFQEGVGGRRVLTKGAREQSAKACSSPEARSAEVEFFRRPRVRGRRGKSGVAGPPDRPPEILPASEGVLELKLTLTNLIVGSQLPIPPAPVAPWRKALRLRFRPAFHRSSAHRARPRPPPGRKGPALRLARAKHCASN